MHPDTAGGLNLSPRDSAGQEFWYVAYGSNTSMPRLQRHLDDLDDEAEARSRWVHLTRATYFAGDSKTWGGPVAFLSLRERGEWVAECRAFPLSEAQLAHLFKRENGCGELPSLAELAMSPGEWRQILVPWAPDGRRGKYNAVVRLPDIDGSPAYTFSTSRELRLGQPSDSYVDAMLQGLRQQSSDALAGEYLSDAANTAEETNLRMLEAVSYPIWVGEVRRGGAAGFPVVRLPQNLSPVMGPRAYLGRIKGGDSVETWVDFSLPNDDPPSVSGAVANLLGLSAGSAERACIQLEPIIQLHRRSGLLTALPLSDVAHVSPHDVNVCGSWLLAVSPHYSGPLRVKAHESATPGEIRLAYAARTLLSVQASDLIVYQSIPHPRAGRFIWLRNLPLRLLESLLGAPTVALRATEGLVGDDGRKVARADATAFDFLGISPGDRAILSWGQRATKVRLLAQTSETRECMEEQLAETTGRQTRDSLSNVESRAHTPAHLRIWISSTVRNELSIPPDTVVRLRRDLVDVCLRNTSSAAVPTAGLIIAAVAVPSVPAMVWLLAGLLVFTLVALPLRRK